MIEKPLIDPAAAAQQTSLLSRIQGSLPDLRKSERTVAEFVLGAPNAVLSLSIAELALRVGVSQPTVARFANALGFAGYKEFKLRLAQSLASGVPYVHGDVNPDDPLEQVGAKVFDRTIGALLSVRNHLDPQQLEQAVRTLAQARQLEIYGIGNSGIVAQDAQHKLFRLRPATLAHVDAHTMRMAAALLAPGDAVLAISATGRSTDVIESVEMARESGVEVVAITHSGSALARLATTVLYADVPEDPDLYAPMTSRLAHLTIIDVLAVGMALRLGPELLQRLQRAKRTLQHKRARSEGN